MIKSSGKYIEIVKQDDEVRKLVIDGCTFAKDVLDRLVSDELKAILLDGNVNVDNTNINFQIYRSTA